MVIWEGEAGEDVNETIGCELLFVKVGMRPQKSIFHCTYAGFTVSHFGMWIISSWRQPRPKRLRKSFLPPPYLALRIQKEGLVQEELLSSEITTKSKWDGCGKLWGAGRAYSSWDGVPLSLYLARQTCLSNNCSSHLPVNCIPCLWSPRLLAPCP